MEGIDDQRRNPGCFEMRKHALPINSRALHHHLLDAMRSQPVDQGTHVALEPAKLAGVLQQGAVLLLDQDGHDVLHSMHIHPGHTLMDWFHRGSPMV